MNDDQNSIVGGAGITCLMHRPAFPAATALAKSAKSPSSSQN
jgi:hypothetical protein